MRIRQALTGILSVLLLAGCTSNYYRKSADRAAYGAIQKKTPLVKNMDPHFTIEQTNVLNLTSLAVNTNVQDFLGEDGKQESGARVLKLEDALLIATRHSRTYQNRKERLYLSGLSLTLARHRFTPIFSGNARVDYSVEQIEEEITVGTNTIATDKLVEEHTVDGSGTIEASWLIRDVGRLSAAFTADFLRFVTGDPTVTRSSELSAEFLRPLLRNAGFKAEKEALIQAERDLLYELRDFTQFRKDFSVQIARNYYEVLGRRDSVRNSFLALQSSRKNAERMRALVEQGRSTTAQLGRLEQSELSAETSWISAVRSYKQALDSFKIELGLTVDAHVILDDAELAGLQIRHPEIKVEDAIAVALAGRLDYLNVRDQLEDASRQVALAKNFLKPDIDLVASGAIESNPDDNTGFPLPDPKRYRWNAGLVVDPGLDRTSERNDYRASIIDRNRAARDVEQREDEIKLEVRESWRTLEQARRNYEINLVGVRLAERRVEEQDLLAEVGRAQALDQVDAQDDLIASRNQLTQALVTHTIARLEFWNNMGILYIKENGQWEEIQHATAK